MSENVVQIRFLDKQYEIPRDVITLVKCRGFVSNGLVKLLNETSELLKKYSKIGCENAFQGLHGDMVRIQNIMKSVVEEVKKDLINRGIYDVDERRLMKDITSIDEITCLTADVVSKIGKSAIRVHSERETNMDYAYKSAASNITGSGVQIYTNSMSSLMLHSVLENNILKSQAKEADKQYEAALKRINSQTENKLQRIYSDGLFNDFLPSLPAIFARFHDELLKNYLSELSRYNQFDIECVEQYDETKSCTILENMKYVDDKRSLLIQAFEICPYNIRVYEKMLQLNYYDMDTLKDASKVISASELSSLIKKLIGNNFDECNMKKEYVTLMAYYNGVNEKTILKGYYQSEVSKITRAYNDVFMICTEKWRLEDWIKERISMDMDEVVETTENEIRTKVESWIRMKVDEELCFELTKIGVLTVEDICVKNSMAKTVEDVKTEYTNIMIAKVMDYIEGARVRKKVYQDAYKRYNSELSRQYEMIDNKKAELKKSNFFSFSKKKELLAKIELLQAELEDFKKNEPIELYEAYYGRRI